jgi:quercetin dioxygenase-like cupin family protein
MRPLTTVILLTTGLVSSSGQMSHMQLEPSCEADSPERHGEIGCSLVEDKALTVSLKEPLYWHIDTFDTSEKAKAAVLASSVAFDAHGKSWLLSVESLTNDHHGGTHIAQVLLPSLPKAERYSLLAMSAYIPQGMTSRVHHHSGVEAFYTVDGQQCLETENRAYNLPKGEILAVPAGIPMRLVANGSTPRRALAVIVYDSAQPPTVRMDMSFASQLKPCSLASSR